ncbi:2-oxoadipate dioxygenase/decarboxylase family protein [Salmonella enterica]|uniref:2-oxoadipate dioxygenase/decarboxylase family protein n=1 Tax=Salmonella enterica TaxID=28901 RepID=UPI003D2EB420
MVIAQPITYEDFLPVSAAGIFQSNLGNETLPEATAMPAATPLNSAGMCYTG